MRNVMAHLVGWCDRLHMPTVSHTCQYTLAAQALRISARRGLYPECLSRLDALSLIQGFSSFPTYVQYRPPSSCPPAHLLSHFSTSMVG